eukprot:6176019-Pleurochrysis_carterae.AAC.3
MPLCFSGHDRLRRRMRIDNFCRMPAGIIGEAVAQGDGRELCIAAASIFARVCRDAAMQSLHRHTRPRPFALYQIAATR